MSARRLIPIALGIATIALVACASTSGPNASSANASSSTTTTAPPTTTTEPAPLPGEAVGAFVYRSRCAGCHGRAGEGELGPPLTGIVDHLSAADETAIVRHGKGRMPSWQPPLTDAQVDAVVEYTRSELH